ncbi:hypothetical protein Tco_0877239 [Tanacetum coccineum]|uniref:Uncharacterized protein n=1 Tax=Tanacetum coccineum TaxID=301880 RepID=A0ABQ5BW21_9ASTR
MALLLAEERFLKIKQALEEEQNQPENIQEFLLKLINDLQILNGIPLKQEEQAAKPEHSLIMGDEHLRTIPEKESDEFIKSSVEDVVPIPSESGDTYSYLRVLLNYGTTYPLSSLSSVVRS